MWPFSKPNAPPPPTPAEVPEKSGGYFSTEAPLGFEGLGEAFVAAISAKAFLRKPTATMDEGVYNLGSLQMPEAQASWYAGQTFIGYQMCGILAQHWLINKACLLPARDAMRHGFEITVNGAELDPRVLPAVAKANKRHKLDLNLVEFVKMGRVFGIRLALCKVESRDPEYYAKPFNIDSVTPGSYRGIVQIDPYWAVPQLGQNDANNPASPGFYEPTFWTVGAVTYHKSHFIIMKGPEVSDILKPSYLFGGLSVPQLIYERVYAAERTANEAPLLAMTKRSNIWYTNTAKAMADPARLQRQMEKWATLRDNYGVKIADLDDRIESQDTGLADLDSVIMTQYQIVAAAANVPATKLLGTTPKGFNSSGDYEADSYHEELESIQTNDMEPLVERHVACVIRSEVAPALGIKPFDFDVTWRPVKTMSAKERAEVNHMEANTAKILTVDIGAVASEEVRNKLVQDEHSGYNGLPQLEDLDGLADEETQNLGR